MTESAPAPDYTPQAAMVPAVDPALVAAVLAAMPALGMQVVPAAAPNVPAVVTGQVVSGTIVGQQQRPEDWSLNKLMAETVRRVGWHSEYQIKAALAAVDKFFPVEE